MSKIVSDIKNQSVAIKSKLLNISRETGRDYNQILTRYFQERLLYRLSVSRFSSSFVLKGGALLYAYDRHSARPTLDIDLLGHDISRDKQFLTAVFTEICRIDYPQDGVHYMTDSIIAKEIMTGKHYNGVNVSVKSQLDTISQTVSMDIGFGDIVIPEPVSLDYPLFLDEMPPIQLNAYSLETVVAEKFQTMIEKSEGNSRMKDYYDVYTILNDAILDDVVLEEAIRSVFENRDTGHIDNHPVFSEEFRNDPARIAMWNSFLGRIKFKGELEFQDVMLRITSVLKPIWDDLK